MMSKYNLSVLVCWRDVLKTLRWSLRLKINAFRYHSELAHDCYLLQKFEEADMWKRDSLSDCEQFYRSLELLNSLRAFLRYKPCTPDSLKASDLQDYYLTETGTADDVAVDQ